MTTFEEVKILEPRDMTITFPDPNTKEPGSLITIDFLSGRHVFRCTRVKDGATIRNVWHAISNPNDSAEFPDT